MHNNQSTHAAQPERRHGDIRYFLNTTENQQVVQTHKTLHRSVTEASTHNRSIIYRQLFSKPAAFFIEPDFFCEYPQSVSIDSGTFFNHNCVILGSGQITIGEGVFVGPNVIISTAPIAGYKAHTSPIVIEDGVWIGANSLIVAGAHIGRAAIIGANTVVGQNVEAECRFYNAPVLAPGASTHD